MSGLGTPRTDRTAGALAARAGLLLLLAWLVAGIVMGFTVPMPDRGFRDLEAYRAVFFHVPLAWAGCLAFILAAVHGGHYLATRRLLADAAACAAAEIGLVMTGLATVIGMVFAYNQWGVAWNWEPRQTSVFMVMLLYAAYLMLRQALPPDAHLRAKLGAAYLLLAVAPMIWLVAVFPRTVKMSLHPEKAPFDPVHWQVMFFNLAGLIGVYALLAWLHGRIARARLAGEEQW